MRRRTWWRWLIRSLVALLLLMAAAYAYVTRPAALRERLVRLCAEADLRLIRLGEASFSPQTGLHLLDLAIQPARASPLIGLARPDEAPPLLRIPRAVVRFSPWALLVGQLRPREVELDGAEIALVWPATGSAGLVRFGAAEQAPGRRAVPQRLPRLTIRDSDLSIFVMRDGGLHLQQRWIVEGSGQPVAQGAAPGAYLLRLERVAGAVSAPYASETPLASLRWQGDRLAAELGWVDLDLVRAFLPPAWVETMRQLGLAGSVRVQPLVLERGALVEAALRFNDLRCSVPIEDERDLSPERRFAQLTGLEGYARFVAQPAGRQGDLYVQAGGRLNGAAARFSLALSDLALAGPSDATSAQSPDPLVPRSRGGLPFGRYQARLRLERLRLPTHAEHSSFVTARRLPGAVRSVFRKYRPEGLVNFELELWGEAGLAARGAREPAPADEQVAPGATVVHYRGAVEPLGAACCYTGFPYAVEDAYGVLRFSDAGGIVLEGLHGRHGTARIRADGRVVDSKTWTGFELLFRGENVALDADLYAALPPVYQRLWEDAAPVGLCDVQVAVGREHGTETGGARPTEVRVDARLLSASVRLLDEARLDHADGLIHIAEGVVGIDALRGYVGQSLVQVDGRLQLAERQVAPQFELHVEAADVPLQRSSEIRDSLERPIGAVHFEGTGDVWAQVSSGEQPQRQFAVRVRDGRLTGPGAGPPWFGARGWLFAHGDQQSVRELSAQRPDGTLEISGVLPRQLGRHAPLELEVRAADGDLQRLLRQLVPGRWGGIRDALGLGGRGRLAARFHPAAAPGGEARQAADICLEAERMRPTPLPLELRDIQAQVTLHAQGFDVRQAAARYGEEGYLNVSGHGGWADGNVWSDVSVQGHDLRVGPELVAALPGPLAALLERMAPRGRMDLALDQVRVTGAEKLAWRVAGQIVLDSATLNLGAPLTGFAGRLEGACESSAAGDVRLGARFELDRGWLAGRPVERWEGELVRDPGSRRLRLVDLRGRLCDGELVGSGAVDLEAEAYELSFTLRDLSLAQFLQRGQRDGGGLTRGRLDGSVFLRGSTADVSQRSGGGQLRIRGSSLLSSAVTASLLESTRQQRRPISDEVELAELQFIWEAQELHLTRVDIRSRDLRLIGVGRWDMRSDALEMTLLGAAPADAPRLFLLTELLETAGQELVQYRVEGTAADPRVTIEPLHNLTEPLRKLLKAAGE